MLPWIESLAGPRSLVTATNAALVTIEDPGVIDLRGSTKDRAFSKAVRDILGVTALPARPWASVTANEIRLLWRGPDRFLTILPREQAAGTTARLSGALGKRAFAADLTGAYAALRLVGAGTGDVLMRTCPLNTHQIGPDEVRGTTMQGIRVVLVREGSRTPVWLILAPRSLAHAVAEALVELVKSAGQLNLFGPCSVKI